MAGIECITKDAQQPLVNPQGTTNKWTSAWMHGSMSLMHGQVSGKDVHYISTTVMSMSSYVELDHLIEKWEMLDYEHDGPINYHGKVILLSSFHRG